jgi:hypothetical protein
MSGNITSDGRLVARKDSDDGAEAVRVADSQKRTSATDLKVDGTLSYTIGGSSPQGEEDSLDVCKVLIQRLNLEGRRWAAPTKPGGPEGGIDCVTSDGQQELHIQVTRAVSNQDIWRKLGQSGTVATPTTVQDAANDLLNCAKVKAQRVPRDELARIVLALNAMDTPGHSLCAVTDDFRKRHGQAVRALGFKVVWVVGPLTELTTRLDA